MTVKKKKESIFHDYDRWLNSFGSEGLVICTVILTFTVFILAMAFGTLGALLLILAVGRFIMTLPTVFTVGAAVGVCVLVLMIPLTRFIKFRRSLYAETSTPNQTRI